MTANISPAAIARNMTAMRLSKQRVVEVRRAAEPRAASVNECSGNNDVLNALCMSLSRSGIERTHFRVLDS